LIQIYGLNFAQLTRDYYIKYTALSSTIKHSVQKNWSKESKTKGK